MAKIIKQLPDTRNKYPWDEWTDGQSRVVAKGIDFTCDLKAFTASLFNYANRNRLKVTTRTDRAKKTVAFLFTQKRAGSRRV